MPKLRTVEKSMAIKIAGIIDSKKGEDIVILDMRKVSTITDFFIIATGLSVGHLQSLAKNVIEITDESPANSIKNLENNWVLLDYSNLMVHLFLKETREYYDLENLWADAKRIPALIKNRKRIKPL